MVDASIYIDLEGTQVDPPSLLGVLYPADLAPNQAEFIQYVSEFALAPAARFRQLGNGVGSWCLVEPLESAFRHVIEVSEGSDRSIVAWSEHELNVARVSLEFTDFARFSARYVNAIPVAKKWLRKAHPGVVLPKSQWLGRNQLSAYMELVDMRVPKAFGPGHTAARIRDVRGQLARRAGDYGSLTPVAKGKWTKMLMHNYFDCIGTRAVLRACFSDESD